MSELVVRTSSTAPSPRRRRCSEGRRAPRRSITARSAAWWLSRSSSSTKLPRSTPLSASSVHESISQNDRLAMNTRPSVLVRAMPTLAASNTALKRDSLCCVPKPRQASSVESPSHSSESAAAWGPESSLAGSPAPSAIPMSLCGGTAPPALLFEGGVHGGGGLAEHQPLAIGREAGGADGQGQALVAGHRHDGGGVGDQLVAHPDLGVLRLG